MGYAIAGKSQARSQPHTMCVFVQLVASKSLTLLGEYCKCEWGLPDGRHPERHKEGAKRNHIVHGSEHTGSGCRWELANHSPGESSPENADKVRPQFPTEPPLSN